MNFIQNKKIGFERNQVLILDNAEPLREKALTLKKKRTIEQPKNQ